MDNEKPNQYTIKEKVMWLSFIEAIIINEVLKTHEGYDGRYDMFEGYSEDKLTVKLIVPAPYDRLYTQYLKMKIDEANGEITRYNNSAALYNAYMSEYRKYYNKTHMPIDVTKKTKDIVIKVPMGNGLTDAEMENIIKELTYIITQKVSGATSPDILEDIVNEYVQNNIEMLKGKDGRDGVDGKDGYTPQKNIDYFDGKPFLYTDFTSDQLNALKGEKGVKGDKGDRGDQGATGRQGEPGINGQDGRTPIKGIDYYTEEEKQELIGEIKDDISVVNGDLNQNDETAPDYVKNRTHYEIPKVILGEAHKTEEETTMENGFDGICDVYIDKSLVEVGKEYKYTINGQSGTFIFNNEYMNFGGAAGQVFDFGDNYDWQTSWAYGSTIDIILYDGGEVKQLDEKYIPDTIARVSDVQAMIGTVNDELESILNGGVD